MSKELKNMSDTLYTNSGDQVLLDLFGGMMRRYNESVILPTGHLFNQSILIDTINSYLMSKYAEANANETEIFFNEMRKARADFIRKTHIPFQEIAVHIDDKAINYLTQAAKEEFADDYHMDDIQHKWGHQMGTYGTVAEKVVYNKGKKHVVEVVPFENFLCDPVDGKSLPKGEVKTTSLHSVLNSEKFSKEQMDMIEHKIMNVYEDLEIAYNPKKLICQVAYINGRLPKAAFHEGARGYVDGAFTVLRVNDHEDFILYKKEGVKPCYEISVLEEVSGRTMGFGPMEAMLQYQIAINRMGNKALSDVESSMIMYQTQDSQLDGQDLQELDQLSLIMHEQNSPITQVSASPQAFGAAMTLLSSISAMGKESASIQDSSLGRSVKSNVSFAALKAASAEADGVYNNIKSQIFQIRRKMFKRDDGYLDMIIDYYRSGKAIEHLLTDYQKLGFRKFIAEQDAAREQEKQQAEGAIYIDPKDKLADFFLAENAGRPIKIKFNNNEINRKDIIDKMRLTLSQNNDIISNKVAHIERLHDIVSRNPELYPSFNANDLLVALGDLVNLAENQNLKVSVQTSQGGQLTANSGGVQTGPQVAAQAGLV